MPKGMEYMYQKTGGSVSSSPGDKIKGSKCHKSSPKRLDSVGGTHNRGTGNVAR